MKYDSQLEDIAKRLGADAAQRLDVDATARQVVQRLREQPAPQRVWIQQTWLRIAAALVIVVGGAVITSRLTHPVVAGHAAHFVADDLTDLSTEQLRDVLSGFDDIVTSDSVAVPESSTDLRELDAQQLRAVLRSLEG